MPDTWRCECGYTNLGSKTCLVCRRPRQAVPPPRPEPVDDAPAEEPEEVALAKKPAKRPLKARAATKKRPVRKRRD
jgi:hypothetical protein